MNVKQSMDVKQLLYDNVRGRVRARLWDKVVADLDKREKELPALDDKGVIKYLYKRTKYWYKQYESLLKEMEEDEGKTES